MKAAIPAALNSPRRSHSPLMFSGSNGEIPRTFSLGKSLAPAKGEPVLTLRAKLRRGASRLLAPLEQLCMVDQINGIHYRAANPQPWNSQGSFLHRALRDINISYHVSDADRARFPRTGPLVVVANHPFGAAEGMILADLLGQVRPDTLMMCNYLLGQIPELHENCIMVDPFGGSGATVVNTGPMRQAIRHVRSGGSLGVFPAGEVANLDLSKREITDSPWSTTVARVIQMSHAQVVPVFFSGNNSRLFQMLGLVHPRLRTAMLARELLNKRGCKVELRVGSVIPYRRLAPFADPVELMAYLRQRTFVLRHRQAIDEPVSQRKMVFFGRPGVQPGGDGASVLPSKASSNKSHIVSVGGETIVPPVPVELLERDMAALSKKHLLIDTDDYAVFAAERLHLPNIVREIGRLREISYRATGEGTGRSIDLDRFDDWYLHLFIWHKSRKTVVGAYRLGLCDQIVKRHGIKGLYTSTLFKYKRPMVQRVGDAVELGRSFIRAEYQRNYQPLLLLWKGIGRLISAHPQCKVLWGPVSISGDYNSVSRQLMVQFLQAQHMDADLAPLARPRNPFRVTGVHGFGRDIVRQQVKESDDISELVSEIEPDGKGIPVLLRQYLKLGARFFSINVDADFNDAVDALMIVDLTQTAPRLLERYLGKEAARQFLSLHGSARPAMAIEDDSRVPVEVG